jgi:hypothetical protein
VINLHVNSFLCTRVGSDSTVMYVTSILRDFSSNLGRNTGHLKWHSSISYTQQKYRKVELSFNKYIGMYPDLEKNNFCYATHMCVHSFIHSFIHNLLIHHLLYSLLLCPGLFFNPVIFFYTDCRTPWTGISPSQGRYLHTMQHKHRINAHTDISLELDSNP